MIKINHYIIDYHNQHHFFLVKLAFDYQKNSFKIEQIDLIKDSSPELQIDIYNKNGINK